MEAQGQAGQAVDESTLRRAIAACAIGNATEWFDATYGFLAATLGAVFFPSGNETVQLLSAFAVFALTFFVRPLGGYILAPGRQDRSPARPRDHHPAHGGRYLPYWFAARLRHDRHPCTDTATPLAAGAGFLGGRRVRRCLHVYGGVRTGRVQGILCQLARVRDPRGVQPGCGSGHVHDVYTLAGRHDLLGLAYTLLDRPAAGHRRALP